LYFHHPPSGAIGKFTEKDSNEESEEEIELGEEAPVEG